MAIRSPEDMASASGEEPAGTNISKPGQEKVTLDHRSSNACPMAQVAAAGTRTVPLPVDLAVVVDHMPRAVATEVLKIPPRLALVQQRSPVNRI
jgi:hypothetical protein